MTERCEPVGARFVGVDDRVDDHDTRAVPSAPGLSVTSTSASLKRGTVSLYPWVLGASVCAAGAPVQLPALSRCRPASVMPDVERTDGASKRTIVASPRVGSRNLMRAES